MLYFTVFSYRLVRNVYQLQDAGIIGACLDVSSAAPVSSICLRGKLLHIFERQIKTPLQAQY